MQKYKDYRPTQFDPRGLAADRLNIGEYLVLPVMQTRDSGPIEQSNFDTVVDMLGGESEDVQVHRFGHWGPGWFEIILVNPDNAGKVAIAENIESRLDDYPLLDEEDVSRREWEVINEYWEQMSTQRKMQYCQESHDCIFAARAKDFSDFSERAPRAAERIEQSGRE